MIGRYDPVAETPFRRNNAGDESLLLVSKLLVRLGLGMAVVAVAVLAGLSCYFAGRIELGTLHVDHSFDLDLRVVTSGNGRIEFEALEGASQNRTKDGIWGLEWPGGYGRVGRIIEIDGKRVVRELSAYWDQPALGTLVRVDSLSFPPDPQKALGVAYQDVTISSLAGDFPAWLIPGSRDTWVVGVHGMNSRREEAFRLFETTIELGFPSLTITYRNDAGVPASADGRYNYGRTEWEDLEAAVAFARANGARDVILAGYSMGGAIVMSFMERSALAPSVKGLILDAPVLSFGKVIDFQADRRNLPGFLTAISKAIVDWRYGVDWDAVDYRDAAAALSVPVLLFHGDADDRAPISMSDALAKSRPDTVTYVRVPGAGHVRAWNMDPAAYGAAVRRFLALVAP